jgi:hypothetical protein
VQQQRALLRIGRVVFSRDSKRIFLPPITMFCVFSSSMAMRTPFSLSLP